MNNLIKVIATCGVVVIVAFMGVFRWNQSKVEKTEKELFVGKETTTTIIIIHDTIHDSIPYKTINFNKNVTIKKNTIKDSNNVKKIDSLSYIDSNTLNCFEFTKKFEGVGTVNVQTCSKTFTQKPDDLNIQMWYYPLPDSIRTISRTDTLNIKKTIMEPTNYYKNIAIGSVLLIIGVVIGKNWE